MFSENERINAFINNVIDVRKENEVSTSDAIDMVSNDDLSKDELIEALKILLTKKICLIDMCESDDEVEFDIYIDDYGPTATYVCDEILKLSKYGIKKYKDILYAPIINIVDNSNRYYNVEIDYPKNLITDEEKFKFVKAVRRFQLETAGYIDAEEYDKIYGDGKYKKGPIEDNYDIGLDIEQKYGYSLDCDFIGQYYNSLKYALEKNMTEDEFDKYYNELTGNEEDEEEV